MITESDVRIHKFIAIAEILKSLLAIALWVASFTIMPDKFKAVTYRDSACYIMLFIYVCCTLSICTSLSNQLVYTIRACMKYTKLKKQWRSKE